MRFSTCLKSTLLGLGLATVGLGAQASTITFDDLSPGPDGSLISSGYEAMNWTNWYADNGCHSTYGGGYCVGTVSGPNVAFNGYGGPATFRSAVSFTLNSLYLTAGWNDNLTVTFMGRALEGPARVMTVTPLADAPTLVTFNWEGVNTIQMFTSGGTAHALYGAISKGTHVAVDNITINEAPTNASAIDEPHSVALMLTGLGALGFIARRRRLHG